MVAVGGKQGEAVAETPCYNLALGILGRQGELFETAPVRHVRIARLDGWFRPWPTRRASAGPSRHYSRLKPSF